MIITVLCLVFFLFSVPVYAQDSPGTQHVAFTVGPQFYHHKLTYPGYEYEGSFSGVAYNLTYEKGLVVSLNGSLAYGQTDYSSNVDGSIDDMDNYAADTRLIIGYAFLTKGRVKMTPYAGIGYRYLGIEGNGMKTITGAWGYDQESRYMYSPIGIMLDIPMGRGWSFLPSAEFDIFWKGIQKNEFGAVSPLLDDLEFDLNGGHGLRFSLGVEKKMTRFALGLELFYRYWDIDKSDTVTGGYFDPANETEEMGIGVSCRF